MAIIRSYNQPLVDARAIPNVGFPGIPNVNSGQPLQAEGQARDLQVAGAQLERASNATDKLATGMMDDANEARVQDLANGFMSGSQFTLYTDKDAFYRKKGRDAINGAQDATDKLIGLKKETIGLAANEYQRQRLEKMLGAQVLESTNGISRHVAQQSMEWEKNVAAGRQQILANDTSLNFNDFDKVEKNAAAAESVAREQAKQAGVSGTEAETAMVAAARSNHYTTAIQQRLQNDQKRSALALYDKVKGQLDEKDSVRLASAMKSTATDVEADNWILGNSPNNLPPGVKQYAPQVLKASAEYGVEPALVNAVMAQESRGVPGQTSPAGAGGLMQIMPKTAGDLGVANVHDTDQNIRGGAKYLSQMQAKYNGDQKLTLMAYNWGPGNVDNWLKTGSDPAKVPQETRDYVQKVNGYLAGQGVGADKANTQGLVLAALNDPSLSLATKSAVATKLTKESAALEATRTATIKNLDDSVEATVLAMVLSPSSYKKGTLSTQADAYASAGDKSKAVTTSALAAMEDTLLGFSSSPKSAQDETMRLVATSLAPGNAKSLTAAITAAGNKDKVESAKQAGEELSGLKTAATNGVRMETMEAKARAAVDLAVKGGDFTKAREIADFYDGQVKAQAGNQAPPTQIATAITGMRTQIEQGEQSNTAIRQLDAMKETQQKQDAAFSKDAFAAGTTLYDLGPVPPINWNDKPENIWQALDIRGNQARQISSRREGLKVIPLSDPDVAALRQALSEGSPEQQTKIMSALAYMSPEHIPGVAAALAGKNDTGDPLSRSYAAALGLLADRDPTKTAVADQVLRGARIIKEMGASGKKPPDTSDPWQAALQDRVGATLSDMGAKVPAIISDAIASIYTYQMHQAGKQGEKLDPDVLDKSITAALGTSVTVRGQGMYPPKRGMDRYDVEATLARLQPTDLPAGLRTLEGDEITADKIKAYARFSNVGEGIYKVRVPDPRRGGDLAEVLDPATGQAWLLDMKPLLERAPVATSNPDRDYAPTGPQKAIGARNLPLPAPAP